MKDDAKNPPTVVLLVEDSAADASLATEALEQEGYEVDWVDRMSSVKDRYEPGRYRALVVDLDLPDSRGVATIEQLVRIAPGAPIVVLSGLADEAMARYAVRDCAFDYVFKDTLPRLGRAVARAVEHRRLVLALNDSRFSRRELASAMDRRLTELAERLDAGDVSQAQRLAAEMKRIVAAGADLAQPSEDLHSGLHLLKRD